MLRHALSALAVLTVLTSASTAYATPVAFNHTGRLLDVQGVPINDDVTITVSLSETDGGASFWSQEFADVTLSDGYFAVEVGPGTPALTAEILDKDQVWLSTSFPGGTTSSHRLLAVPYATRALVADSVMGQQGAVVQMATVQTRAQPAYTGLTFGDGPAITPMDITMTPRKAGNHVLLEWTLNGEVGQDTVFVVTRNGVRLPDATNGSNNRWAGTSVADYDLDNDSTPATYVIRIVDMDTLAVETTYRVHVRSSDGANRSFRLNHTMGLNNRDNYEASLSVGTATEIWQND